MKKVIQVTTVFSMAIILTACSSMHRNRSGYSSSESSSDYSTAGMAGTTSEASGAESSYQSERASGQEQVITLHEERLNVGKQTVNAGQVRIRKIVTTETASQPVELRRERVVIERIPAGSGSASGSSADTSAGAAFQEKDITIQLQEEQPVVEKQTVVTGQVVARKNAQMQRQNVQREIRREDVQLDRSGNTANIEIKGDFNEAAGAERPRHQSSQDDQSQQQQQQQQENSQQSQDKP